MQPTQQNQYDNSFNQQSITSRVLTLPLMSKKQNTVEKYVNSYKINPKNIHSIKKQEKNSSLLSSNAERLVFEGKLTPDPRVQLLNQKKCYVRYSPLLQHNTQQKLQQLGKMQLQYQHLKHNLSNRSTLIGKNTVPVHRNVKKIKQGTLNKIELSQEQIQKQLRKQILIEDGQKYFADLYMMKKDRNQIKNQIQRQRKFTIKQQAFEQKHKERQKYLIQKKTKEAEQRKNKMLKNKGLHWNVYYQMLALSKNQKTRIIGSNSHFVSTFGVD